MTAPDSSEASNAAAVLLARAGWLTVSEAILAGLCHDLSNRAASLEGLVQLLEEESSDMLVHVGSEVRRLGDSVKGFRALTGSLEAEAEALLLSDVVVGVQELHRRRRGLEAVTAEWMISEGLPPVLANPTRLTRVLLILMDEVALATLESGGREVSVNLTGSLDEVCCVFGYRADVECCLRPETLLSLRALVAPGRWVLVEEAASVRLTIPSLARSRAFEN